MIGGGVNKVSTRKADFYWDQLLEVKRMLKTTSVRSILLDDEGLLWLGIGTYGLGVKDRQTGKFTYYTQMPEFARYHGKEFAGFASCFPVAGSFLGFYC